jgi:hypothetical protein
MGQHEQAAALVKSLADDPRVSFPEPGSAFSRLAKVMTKCSTVVPADSPLRERYATQAVGFLRKAFEIGYYKDAQKRDGLEKIVDFAPLRGRADFKKLLDDGRKATAP